MTIVITPASHGRRTAGFQAVMMKYAAETATEAAIMRPNCSGRRVAAKSCASAGIVDRYQLKARQPKNVPMRPAVERMRTITLRSSASRMRPATMPPTTPVMVSMNMKRAAT